MLSRTALVAFITMVAAVPSLACNGGVAPGEGLPDRETFISAWVDFRLAGLQRPGLPITEADRNRILDQHGVTEEELLRFAEVVGQQPGTMQEILIEIRRRVEAQRTSEDPG